MCKARRYQTYNDVADGGGDEEGTDFNLIKKICINLLPSHLNKKKS